MRNHIESAIFFLIQSIDPTREKLVAFSDLEFEHVLLLIAGIIALLPSYKLFRLYFETKIGEYFLFGLVFFVSTLFTIKRPCRVN